MLLSSVSRGQPHKLDTPADSPLWWTLTDEISPEQLKALYSDRSLSLARYDDAVEAGLAQPLPDSGERSRACLIFYRNAQLTPELEPMWNAFRAFYNAHLDREFHGDEYVDAIPHRLQEFGISPQGANVIVAAAISTEAEVKRRLPEFIPKLSEATLLIDEIYSNPTRAASAPPVDQFRDAMEARDYAMVAGVTGRPESEIRELVDSYANWNVPYELVAEALPALKKSLSEPDWQGFRRYLLETVVAEFGTGPHFKDYCGEGVE
ncbi:MAG: hypothetical protein ACRD2Z_15675 [Thermoanaerobaculia bacterium]